MQNIGIDIIENKRINKEIGQKILSNKEYEFLNTLKPENLQNEFISGRWAAKEAIIKASNKKIIFSQIEILKDKNGAPKIYINNKKSKKFIVSISHEKNYTVAIAFKKITFFRKY